MTKKAINQLANDILRLCYWNFADRRERSTKKDNQTEKQIAKMIEGELMKHPKKV